MGRSENKDDAASKIEATLKRVAEETGGTLRAYPRPGTAVRQVVLREWSDAESSQYEDAVLEEDGTVRVSGRDRGLRVSMFYGPSITSYEWAYLVAPDRVPALISALGGAPGDDPLGLLASYYRTSGRRLSDLLRGPKVGAEFSNWHS